MYICFHSFLSDFWVFFHIERRLNNIPIPPFISSCTSFTHDHNIFHHLIC